MSCKRCGKCCTEYAVSIKDVVFPKRMKKTARELFKVWGWEKFNPNEQIALKRACQHLRAPNICRIYDNRPHECRVFQCADALAQPGYNDKVLVACVTFAGKEPALQRWLEAYHNLTYKDKSLFVVDNTGVSDAYLKELRKRGVDSTRIVPSPTFEDTYRRGWELILEKAKQLGCYWIYSVEADNIVAPESLKTMILWAMVGNGKEGEERVGGVDQNIHIVTHGYPMHESAAKASGVDMSTFRYQEMGCMLLSTQLLEYALAEWQQYRNIPHSLTQTCIKYGGKHLYLDYQFEVLHLDTYQTEFWQFKEMEEKLPTGETLICPTPVAPPEYGTETPPSLRYKQ